MTYTSKNAAQLRAKAGTPAEILSGELALIDAEIDTIEALASGKIIVGNASGAAADVTMSGDATISNAGVLTIADEAVTVGKMADLLRGSIISGQTENNRPAALAAATEGALLIGDGTDLVSAQMSGDATISSAGVVTIANLAVTEDKIASFAGDSLNAQRIARATYDFSVDGGTAGPIGLGVTLPDNAVITRSWYSVETTFTSGDDSATVALGLPTDDAEGIAVATAISAGGNVWDAGYHEGIQDGAATNFSERCTAARELTLTIGVQNLTAGKLILFCEYVVLD